MVRGNTKLKMYLLLVTCSLATQCLVVLVAGSRGLLAERVKIIPHITTTLGKDDIQNSSIAPTVCLAVGPPQSPRRATAVTCPLFVIPREAVNVAAQGSGYCGDSG